MLQPRHEPCVLGIDIGGTKLAAGVVTAGGVQLSTVREATRPEEGPDRILRRLAAMARRAVAESGVAPGDVLAAGVGCGGPLDPDAGVVMNPPNLPGWTRVPVTERLSTDLGLPAYLDNDANAGALGEHRFGAGRGVSNMVYMTISTGIGGGIILCGHLYHGANGNAGELGHMRVVPEGRPCGCGSHGCLEAYASGTSIAARAREAVEAGTPSLLASLAGSPAAIRGETILQALRAGDALARRIWDETVDLLAAGVTNIVNIFNPELVVLGGGIASNFGDLLFEPLRREVRQHAMRPLADAVRIVPAQLGDQVGVMGAAAVALERLGLVAGGAHGAGAAHGR